MAASLNLLDGVHAVPPTVIVLPYLGQLLGDLFNTRATFLRAFSVDYSGGVKASERNRLHRKIPLFLNIFLQEKAVPPALWGAPQLVHQSLGPRTAGLAS
jgi:hypothetical protein